MTAEVLSKINDIDRIILDDKKVSRSEAKELEDFLNPKNDQETKNLDKLKEKPALVSEVLEGIEKGLDGMIESTANGNAKEIGHLDAYQGLLNLLKLENNNKKGKKNNNKETSELNNKITELNDKISNFDSLVLEKRYKGEQVGKENFESSVFSREQFEKPEYKQAFDQLFLDVYNGKQKTNEENTKTSEKSLGILYLEEVEKGSFGERIAEYSKVVFPKIDGLTREANFIIVGGEKHKDNDLQNLYSTGMKLIEVTAKIGGKELYKYKDNGKDVYYTLNEENPKAVDKVYVLNNGSWKENTLQNKTDLLPTKDHKKHNAVIAFGENGILYKLRADRFQEELDKGKSDNELFNNANNIKLNELGEGKDLSAFEQRGSESFKIWLSRQEAEDINNNLPKIFGAVDKLDGKFLDVLVDVILEKANEYELLIKTAIDGIFENKTINKDRLGKTNESVLKNYQKLQDFITKKGWLEKGSDAEKEIAIKVFSFSSHLTTMTPPKTFQEKIGEYAKVLFEHPIGRTILSLIDSMFGGKGRFLRWVNKRDNSGVIANEINEQFRKNYSLSGEQMKFLSNDNGFDDFDQYKKINIRDKNSDYRDGLEDIVKEFNKGGNKKGIDLLAEKLENNGDLLDPKILLGFMKDGVMTVQASDGTPLEVDGQDVIVNIDDVLEADGNSRKVKSDIKADTLKKILRDARIQSAVINANKELIKNGATNEKGKLVYDLTGDMDPPLPLGIQSEKDYAKFLTAYLMGGSKGEGKFQYVITENNLSNAFPVKSETITLNMPMIDSIVDASNTEVTKIQTELDNITAENIKNHAGVLINKVSTIKTTVREMEKTLQAKAQGATVSLDLTEAAEKLVKSAEKLVEAAGSLDSKAGNLEEDDEAKVAAAEAKTVAAEAKVAAEEVKKAIEA